MGYGFPWATQGGAGDTGTPKGADRAGLSDTHRVTPAAVTALWGPGTRNHSMDWAGMDLKGHPGDRRWL